MLLGRRHRRLDSMEDITEARGDDEEEQWYGDEGSDETLVRLFNALLKLMTHSCLVRESVFSVIFRITPSIVRNARFAPSPVTAVMSLHYFRYYNSFTMTMTLVMMLTLTVLMIMSSCG